MKNETKNTSTSSVQACQNCKDEFRIEAEDFSFYEKMQVPAPTFCPLCRMYRRIASRNQRSLFKRDCSKCARSVHSMYAPDSPYIVYCTECYFGDDWDASLYFSDYDFTKPFFEQFRELMLRVPQLHYAHTNNNGEDIVFSNFVYRSSKVYLSYGVVRSENIYYSWGSENNNKMCVDCANFSENELCYELVSARGNYGSSFLTRSHASVDSHFSFDCVNCTNCFMSSNLRNKSYVFRNKQLTPEAYRAEIKKEMTGVYENQQALQAEYERLMQHAIHKYAVILHSENCTGDLIINCKNVKDSFFIEESENIRYAQITTNRVTDCYDFSMSGRAENSYEFSVAGRGNDRALFCNDVGDTKDIEYCDSVNNVTDLFGCTGLKNKKYCILNKQYTKEEYEALLPKIKQHMMDMPFFGEHGRVYKYGEYFPFEISRFPFNQSNFFELYPMEKEEALAMGYSWVEQPRREHVASSDYHDVSILETDDSILKETFACEHGGSCNHICSAAFRITLEEFQLYKKLKLALPRLCPNCRYFKRLERLLPWKQWHRVCQCTSTYHNHPSTGSGRATDKCQIEFETSYSPDRPEKVYCEGCYQKEVI